MDNKDINWVLISEVVASVAKRAKQMRLADRWDDEEIQSEIIAYIFNGTHVSNCLLPYCYGEDTKEKRAKLKFSLLNNKAWLDGLYKSDKYFSNAIVFSIDADVYEAQSFREIESKRLNKAQVINILEDHFNGKNPSNEEEALVIDKLYNISMLKRQVLQYFYKEKMKVADASKIMGFSTKRFYFLRKQGLHELMNVSIPLFQSTSS